MQEDEIRDIGTDPVGRGPQADGALLCMLGAETRALHGQEQTLPAEFPAFVA